MTHMLYSCCLPSKVSFWEDLSSAEQVRGHDFAGTSYLSSKSFNADLATLCNMYYLDEGKKFGISLMRTYRTTMRNIITSFLL